MQSDDEWNDPETGEANAPPVGAVIISLLSVVYSVYLLWVDELTLMLLALIAAMAFYLGVAAISAAREDAL